MKKLLLRRVSEKKYKAVNTILSNNKIIVISSNPAEGTLEELNENLTNEELFLIYRKLRRYYFKRRFK